MTTSVLLAKMTFGADAPRFVWQVSWLAGNGVSPRHRIALAFPKRVWPLRKGDDS